MVDLEATDRRQETVFAPVPCSKPDGQSHKLIA